MAVPKKRLSKSKTRIRKNMWKKKANKKATQILLVSQSYLQKIQREVQLQVTKGFGSKEG